LTRNEKRSAFQKIGEEITETLMVISEGSPQEAKEAFAKTTEFAQEVLDEAIFATQDSTIYQELTNLYEDASVNHSVATSTFCVLMCLGLGMPEPEEFADIALAALLHDMGTLELPQELSKKNPLEMTNEEKEVYYRHPEISLDIMDKQKLYITDNMRAAIADHHENFDGTGYPQKISGEELSFYPQLLHLGDILEYALNGVFDGEKKTFREAFMYLTGINDEQQIVDPELFHHIVHFILISDSAAQSASDTHLKSADEILKLDKK
jgi:HD-GYP domain-containing protein (c-di-GMP phosphodiesterase class II)